MKRIVFILAILATGFYSKAQTEAGKFVLGGDVEFSSTTNDGAISRTTGLLLLPSAGYFITNNLAIGAGIGYQTSRYRQNNISDVIDENPLVKNHGITFSPFIRKYKNIS
jgi:outer membrane protein